MCNGGSLHSLEAGTDNDDRADDQRMSSKPMPGQPPANVE